eukprot:COSAG05_NODE_6780_length_904_cov_1.985093_1_plen_132_part_10
MTAESSRLMQAAEARENKLREERKEQDAALDAMRDEAEDFKAQLATANNQLRAQEEALNKGKTRFEGEAARLQGELEGSKAVVKQFEEKLEQAMGASEKALEHAASWQTKAGEEAREKSKALERLKEMEEDM